MATEAEKAIAHHWVEEMIKSGLSTKQMLNVIQSARQKYQKLKLLEDIRNCTKCNSTEICKDFGCAYQLAQEC